VVAGDLYAGTVMSTKNKKKAATGVRYPDALKKEVVDFVIQYNTANGRGGQSKAASQFKVTPLTVAAWIKAAGKTKAAKPGKASKPAAAAKPAKAAKAAKPAKATKPAKPAKAGKRGVRYAPEHKAEVVKFVSDYNAANGRGGQNQAAKKFKLSILTVSAWLKAAGSKPAKVAAKGKTPKAAKAAKAPKAAKAAAPSGLSAKVAALIAVNGQVAAAERELEKLYAKQDSLMASLKV